MSNEKILEVLKDEAFAKSILEMQTQEQVQAAFKERGIEISKEERIGSYRFHSFPNADVEEARTYR